MQLSAFKRHLSSMSQLSFMQPNGHFVPAHFHITEVALHTKHYIDCSGVERIEKTISMQLWTANDFEHRLMPSKLLQIINQYEQKISADDLAVEIEYQSETIGVYTLRAIEGHFELVPKYTACLAEDACGIPQEKLKKPMAELQSASCCTPGSGCC